MNDNPEWIAEGWRTFQDEVLRKGWPEDPKLRLLLEVAFFGGANWVMMVIGDEGAMPATFNRIEKELRAQGDRVKELGHAIKEAAGRQKQ
jgi:hypothetical protein